jgi:hypothetical protein
MEELDTEIMYAAQLGLTLRDMRRDLSEESLKRVVTFVLERWGFGVGALYVKTLPAQQARPVPPVQPPPVETKPPAAKPIKTEQCPLCEYRGMNEKGLWVHVYRAHGTSLKEIRRQKALDA